MSTVIPPKNLEETLKKKEGGRTSLFNLLVYTDTLLDESSLSLFLKKNVEIFPSRVFWISLKKEGPLEITFTEASRSKDSISLSDQIKIEVTFSDLPKIPFLLYPLILPDLPLYLFLGQDLSLTNTLFPEKNPALIPFLPSLKRVIVDSRKVFDLQKFYERATVFQKKFPIPWIDLLNIEAKDWQNALKQTLQGKDSLLKNLSSIVFTSSEKSSLPLSLLAFLGGRLNFSFKRSFETELKGFSLYTFQGREISFHFDFSSTETSLILASPDEHLELLFHPKELFIEERSTQQDTCAVPQSYPCSTLKKRGGWMREIFYEEIDPFALLTHTLLAHTPSIPFSSLPQQELFYLDSKRKVVVFKEEKEIALQAANFFFKKGNHAILEKGFFTVAFSGGKTPKTLFELLSLPENQNKIEWDKVKVFFSDERAVPPSNPESNYYLCKETLLKKIPIPENQIFRMCAEDVNREEQALKYEALIKQEVPEGRFDLIFLGLGEDGHTASLFPHEDSLKEAIGSRWVIAPFITSKNTYRMSFTFTLLHLAKEILFLAAGENKKEALKGILEENLSFPATFVGTEKQPALFFVDKASFPLPLPQ